MTPLSPPLIVDLQADADSHRDLSVYLDFDELAPVGDAKEAAPR